MCSTSPASMPSTPRRQHASLGYQSDLNPMRLPEYRARHVADLHFWKKTHPSPALYMGLLAEPDLHLLGHSIGPVAAILIVEVENPFTWAEDGRGLRRVVVGAGKLEVIRHGRKCYSS